MSIHHPRPAPPPRRPSPPGRLVRLLVCALLACLPAPAARAQEERAESTAENELFDLIRHRLSRNLSPEMQEANVLTRPGSQVSQSKPTRGAEPLPAGRGEWTRHSRVPVSGGFVLVPVPVDAEELPGPKASVWYNHRLSLRVDTGLAELATPYDWREALPREFHPPMPPIPTVADRLADTVKQRFAELNRQGGFEAWTEIFQADAEDFNRPRLEFAERVAILYRLYKKATHPRVTLLVENPQVRCLVSLPVRDELMHRRTGEIETRWGAAAFISPPGTGPLLRVTFSEPDHTGRELTEAVVLDALGNFRWDVAGYVSPLPAAAGEGEAAR